MVLERRKSAWKHGLQGAEGELRPKGLGLLPSPAVREAESLHGRRNQLLVGNVDRSVDRFFTLGYRAAPRKGDAAESKHRHPKRVPYRPLPDGKSGNKRHDRPREQRANGC
jgi:hypothetical protein